MRYDWNIESEIGAVSMHCCQTLAYKAFWALVHAWNNMEGYHGTTLKCNGVVVSRSWKGGEGPSLSEVMRLHNLYGDAKEYAKGLKWSEREGKYIPKRKRAQKRTQTAFMAGEAA